MARLKGTRHGRNSLPAPQRFINGQTDTKCTGVVSHRQSGADWEKAAEVYLLAQGLRLLNRNFSSRFGEIDLIMEEQGKLVFIEVKYRSRSDHGSGADAVTSHKQGRISRTAAWYLAKNPHRAEQFCRFDVISIDSNKKEQGINWIRNAFYSTLG